MGTYGVRWHIDGVADRYPAALLPPKALLLYHELPLRAFGESYDMKLGNKSLVDSILINLSQIRSFRSAPSRTNRQPALLARI